MVLELDRRQTESFIFLVKIYEQKKNRRNMKRYYQAWEIKQHGLTFKEIGKIMKITASRAAVLSNYIDFRIKY